MAHRVNISVSVPDNLYEGVVLPAKNNHVLAELVCSCLELYSRSASVKEYIDTGAQAKADSEWDAVLDSLNAAVGALDSDVSYLGDSLEAGKSKVAKGYSNAKGEGGNGNKGLGEVSSQELRKVSERVISLEEGFGSVKSMLEDVLGYVKGMSEGGNRSAAVGKSATNKSFAVEDESGETFSGEGSNEAQVSGYSVVQDLKPDTLDNRSYDTEEEPSEQKREQEPELAKVDPQVDSVLSNLADSIRGDMW